VSESTSAALAESGDLGPQAEMLSFAEESCYTKDGQFRNNRCPVVFRVFSIGRGLGSKLSGDMIADYGVYYGSGDEYIIQCLTDSFPDHRWDDKVYWRRPDQSKVDILDGKSGQIIARVETRRYDGRRLTVDKIESGVLGDNVVSLVSERKRLVEAAQIAAESEK